LEEALGQVVVFTPDDVNPILGTDQDAQWQMQATIAMLSSRSVAHGQQIPNRGEEDLVRRHTPMPGMMLEAWLYHQTIPCILWDFLFKPYALWRSLPLAPFANELLWELLWELAPFAQRSHWRHATRVVYRRYCNFVW
jgi:hypothetical protein